MTLVISAIASDGIVVAGDGITTHVSYSDKSERTVISMRSEKVFDFLGEYAIGTAGRERFGSRGIGHILFDIEEDVRLGNIPAPHDFQSLSNILCQQFAYAMINDYKTIQARTGKRLERFGPLRFHIIGYENQVPTIGELDAVETKLTLKQHIGLSVLGIPEAVDHFLPVGQQQQKASEIATWQLQDAVDYVSKLIHQVALREQKTQHPPRIGGELLIAVMTLDGGFEWASSG